MSPSVLPSPARREHSARLLLFLELISTASAPSRPLLWGSGGDLAPSDLRTLGFPTGLEKGRPVVWSLPLGRALHTQAGWGRAHSPRLCWPQPYEDLLPFLSTISLSSSTHFCSRTSPLVAQPTHSGFLLEGTAWRAGTTTPTRAPEPPHGAALGACTIWRVQAEKDSGRARAPSPDPFSEAPEALCYRSQ